MCMSVPVALHTGFDFKELLYPYTDWQPGRACTNTSRGQLEVELSKKGKSGKS